MRRQKRVLAEVSSTPLSCCPASLAKVKPTRRRASCTASKHRRGPEYYATTWFERTNLPAIVAAVGEDRIMFETDYPHPTCLYPDPLKTAAETMRDLSPTAQRKILGENAAKLYHL